MASSSPLASASSSPLPSSFRNVLDIRELRWLRSTLDDKVTGFTLLPNHKDHRCNSLRNACGCCFVNTLFFAPLPFVNLFILLLTISLLFYLSPTVDNSIVRIIPERQTTAEDLTRNAENELFLNERSSFVSRGDSFAQKQEISSNGKFWTIRSRNKVVVINDIHYDYDYDYDYDYYRFIYFWFCQTDGDKWTIQNIIHLPKTK